LARVICRPVIDWVQDELRRVILQLNSLYAAWRCLLQCRDQRPQRILRRQVDGDHDTACRADAFVNSGPTRTAFAVHRNRARRSGSRRRSVAPVATKNSRGARDVRGPLSLLQARLPQAVQHFRRSRLQRWILELLFLVVLGDSIEVVSRAEWRFLKCFERFDRFFIFRG
jgi:hypothetical protein